MQFWKTTFLLSLASISVAHSGTVFVIDDFTGDETLLQSRDTEEMTSVSDGQAGALGGRRDLTLLVSENPFRRRNTLSSGRAGNELFATSFGARANGSASLRYAGAADAGLGGTDFSAAGGEIVFDIDFLDLPTNFSVTLTDTAGRAASVGGTHAGNLFAPGSLALALSDLSADAGFQLNSVDAVDIEITPQSAGGDLVLASIKLNQFPSPVPEPGTAAIAAFGVALLSLRRKRAL